MGVTTWKCIKCNDVQQNAGTVTSYPQPSTTGCTNNPGGNNLHVWGSTTPIILWSCTRCGATVSAKLNDLTAIPSPVTPSCLGGNKSVLPIDTSTSAYFTGATKGYHNWVVNSITYPISLSRKAKAPTKKPVKKAKTK